MVSIFRHIKLFFWRHDDKQRFWHHINIILTILFSLGKLENKQKHYEGPTLRGTTDLILQYKKLKTLAYILTVFSPDNCVSMEGDIIVQIVNILCLKDQFYSLICRRFRKVSEFYDYPCSSKLLNIFKVSHISSNIKEFPFTSVKYKNMLLPGNEKGTYIAFPLLHAL